MDSSDTIGVQILTALGMDINNCISATIKITPKNPIEIKGTFIVLMNDAEPDFSEIKTKTKLFRLIEAQ